MAKVETVVTQNPDPDPQEQSENRNEIITLRPGDIYEDPEFKQKVRPGPQPYAQDLSLRHLADSFLAVGQAVPIIVASADRSTGFRYKLVDGGRRLAAARLVEEKLGSAFFLDCVVQSHGDLFRKAVHANIKRRGYTALQKAYLIQAVREEKGWTGTKEVAAYLGVSRAEVSQHDKLLSKPEGMSQEDYDRLLAIVKEGRMGAEAAFYALTHVEPQKIGDVLDTADRIASKIPAAKAKELVQEAAAPEPAEEPEEEPEEQPAPRVVPTQTPAPAPKPKSKPAPKAAPKPVIKERHVRQAAAERKAAKGGGKPLQRELPDLRRVFGQMIGPKYPDVMRSFVTMLAEVWWRGDATDKELIAKWDTLASCIKPGCK